MQSRRLRRRCVGDLGSRAVRTLAFVTLDTLSAADQASKDAEMAPESADTPCALQNPARRPDRARVALLAGLMPFEHDVLCKVGEEFFAQNVRSSIREAAHGLSRKMTDHRRPLLQSPSGTRRFFKREERLARAQLLNQAWQLCVWKC